MKKLTTLLLMVFFATLSFAQTSSYCETVVTHFNIAAEVNSAIKLTITNVDATSMYVEIESNDADPVDDLLVNNGSGATISDKDESVSGKIKRTLTWATPPTDVSIELLWSKVSMGGMWMLNTFTVPFAANCTPTPIESDATLSDLKVGGTTIDGFASGTLEYNYKLADASSIPALTATATNTSLPTSKVVITNTTTVPGQSTVVVTSEDNSDTKTYKVNFSEIVTLDFDFEDKTTFNTPGGFGGGALTWELNTEKSGINTSDSVLKMVKGPSEVWAGGEMMLDDKVDFSVKANFSLKVFSPRVGVPVLLKFEGTGSTEKTATTTVANQWETLTYDFTGSTSDAYNKLVLIFQNGTAGDGSADWTFLVDDILQYKPTQSTDATLSDIKVDGTTITGFSPSTESYNVTLSAGASVPTVTYTIADANAGAVKTDAGAVPGTTTIVVTAQAGNTKTYSVNFVNPLVLPFDFETSPVTSDFTDFDGGTATVITNPQSSGINTSAKVAQMVRSGGQPWAGSKVIMTSDLDFSTNNGISMKVYTTAPVGTKVAFKLEGAGAVEKSAFTTKSGEWETLTYDFSGTASGFNTVVLLFDLGNTGDGSATSTFLFDDIQQYEITQSTVATLSDLKVDGTTITGFDAATESYDVVLTDGASVPAVTATVTDAGKANAVVTAAASVPGTTTVVVTAEAGNTKTYSVNFAYPLTLPMDFESKPITADFTNFDGAIGTVIDNPQTTGNSSSKVAQIVRSGGQTWAGSKIKLSNNLDFSTSNLMSIDVYTAAPVGTTVKFKIEGGTPAEVDAVTTVTNAWETLTFDFSGKPNDNNTMVFMFDFGNLGDGSSTSTFLFDNITQFAPLFSSDATLSDLKVDGTTVTDFDAATLTYNVKLPIGTTATPVVTATKNDADAADPVITQAANANGTATVVVTAEDGTTTKTYTINFTVLVAQVLPVTFESGPYEVTNNGATLTIIDNPQTTGNSSAKVAQIVKSTAPAGVSTIELTSAFNFSVKPKISMKVYSPKVGAKLKLKIEGTGGAMEKDMTSTLANTWETFVFDFTGTPAANEYNKLVFMFEYGTPGDGSANSTYLIDDIEQTGVVASTDATLSDLKVDGTSVTDFDAAILAYTVELPYGTTTTPTVTATKNDAGAADPVITAATALPGATTVLVTAEDGSTTKTYTVNFTIAAPNTVATLSDIKVDGASIPGFKADSLLYKFELPYGTKAFPTISSVLTDSTAKAVETQATASNRTATIVVTAQDGSTTKTYMVEFIYSAPSTDATLSDLALDGTTISGFKADSMNYPVELPFGTTVVPVVSAASTHDSAKVVLTQAATLNDTAIVVVTAQDGSTTKTYKVSYTVATVISNDATLQNIKVADVALADFAADKFMYTVELPFGTTTVPSVAGTKNNLAATVAMDTAKTLADTAVITVTAQDGVTIKTYKVAFILTDPTYDVTFVVSDGAKGLLQGAQVAFMLDTLTTDINGSVVFTQVSVTTDAAYSVTLEGYEDVTGTLSVVDADVTKEIVMTLKTYDVKFNVTDEAGAAIAKAEVVFLSDTLMTDSTGMAMFSKIAPIADAPYSISKAGYFTKVDTLSVIDSAVIEKVALELEAYEVKFMVADADTLAIKGASIVLGADTVATDSTGMAVFSKVVPGKLAYSIAKEGFVSINDSIEVIDTALTIKAFMLQQIDLYKLSFAVVDADANAIEGASIAIAEQTLTTNAEGKAEIELPAGDASYTITKEGFVEASGTATIIDTAVNISVTLEKVQAETYAAIFTVVDAESNAIADAQVVLLGDTVLTDAEGKAQFNELAPVEEAAYTITKEGYENYSGTITIVDADVEVDVQLITVSIKQNMALVGKIYPNPTNGEVNISLNKIFNKAEVLIYNTNGKLVEQRALFQLETKINLTDVNSGIYLLKLHVDDQLYFGKIVINE